MQSASLVAQRYGMPALQNCPKVQGGNQQAAVTQPLAPGWRLGSDSPYATQQVGAAVLGGRIWVAGGLTGPDSATANTESYDPTVGRWAQGPPLPFPLHHAMMVRYRKRVWVIGGFEPQGGVVEGTVSARVLYLNNTETAWVEGPPLHHARAAGAAVVVGGEIVVVGGRAAGSSPAEVAPTEVFDGTSWHDAAGIPVTGDHVAAASDGRYVYVVGGRKLSVADNTAAVQRFDPNTNTWTQLPPVPGPVSDCGVAVVGGRLIVVGGESIGTVFEHRPGIRSDHLYLVDPAAPGRGPARRGGHGDRQHPLRYRRRSRTRTQRIHPHPANHCPARTPAARSACRELAAGA